LKVCVAGADGREEGRDDARSEETSQAGTGQARKPFVEPELIKHEEPLHEIVMNPFDPQLPLAE
jgi:hypothetical protein